MRDNFNLEGLVVKEIIYKTGKKLFYLFSKSFIISSIFAISALSCVLEAILPNKALSTFFFPPLYKATILSFSLITSSHNSFSLCTSVIWNKFCSFTIWNHILFYGVKNRITVLYTSKASLVQPSDRVLNKCRTVFLLICRLSNKSTVSAKNLVQWYLKLKCNSSAVNNF